ncbi:hypothetical protein [[Pseudomonas] boreopolis]|uniref:hypothetical protein n=1 Tax=Xanthomonas boreopolis TaxID=86183 RepID=UPI003D3D1AAD
MFPSNPDTDARRQWWVVLSILIALIFVAPAVNLIGIALTGGIEGWQRWLDAHVVHFFVWRLCLYAAILAAWPWARKRRLQRAPQSAPQLRRLEILGVGAVLLSETSQWLRHG